MRTLLHMIVLVTLCACASPLRIYTDYDPDYDLWRYRSFAIEKHDTGEISLSGLDSSNEQTLRCSIVSELEKRGYITDQQEPDFVLRYGVIVDDHTVVSPGLAGYFLGPYWMRTRTHKYIDKKETVVLDLLDCKTDHVMWKGWTTTIFHTKESQRELTKVLRKSISIMFKDFPRVHGRPAMRSSVVNNANYKETL